MKKKNVLYTIICCLLSTVLYAQSHSDRLVAMVENKPVMESELLERYNLNKVLQPAYQNFNFEAVRPRLLEEICQEKMNEVLWERVGLNKITPTSEQIQSFKNFYHIEHLADQSITKFYAAKMRENEIARLMVQPQIDITDLELSAFAKQKQAWQAVGALWTFKIGYSATKPLDGPTEYKSFDKTSVDKIQPSLFRQIDWKKTGQWQHFYDDGEYISFYLENIEVPSIALKKYNVELIVLQPLDSDESSWDIARSIPMTVKAMQELSPEIWAALMALETGEISEPIQVASQWYKIKLIDTSDVSQSYESLILSQFKEILRQKKTEEKMPSWYSDMKKNFYINFIDKA